jgi:hypothetical protein
MRSLQPTGYLLRRQSNLSFPPACRSRWSPNFLYFGRRARAQAFVRKRRSVAITAAIAAHFPAHRPGERPSNLAIDRAD